MIDPIFRAGVGHDYIGRRVSKTELSELRDLVNTFPFETLRPRHRCVLNPALTAGPEIGGADIDLIVDDMILDIKTTVDGTCRREYLNQLIGYYLLYREAGISELPRRPSIRRLGLYLSRQAQLIVWRVSDLGSDGAFARGKRWFMTQVRKRATPEVTLAIRVVRRDG